MCKAMYQSAFSSFENCLNSVVVGSEVEDLINLCCCHAQIMKNCKKKERKT